MSTKPPVDPSRPTIRALVGKVTGHVLKTRIVSLEDAVTYHADGWWVFIDPNDEQALATYEREQRSQ